MTGPDDDFEQWYRTEHSRLLAAITVAAGDPEVGHDIVSEAFARALERWDRVATMDSPTGWVRQVAINLLRRRGRRAAMERALLLGQPPPPTEAPSPVIDPDLWAAVRSLPARQRAVLGLRVVLDLSQEDTAELLGIRPTTVSSTLVQAKRAVERTLAPADLTEPGPPEVRHV